jgi:hypothetical protein
MGFWNALSVLAPVAPALSDAQDIRTQRAQDAAKFAQDAELKKAQITAQQMAAQADQQRIFKESTIRDLGWNPVTLSNQALVQDPKTGALTVQDAPGGIDPSVRFKKTVDAYEKTMGRKVTPEENQRFLMQTYGMPGSTSAGIGVPKSVTLKGPNGEPQAASFYGGKYYDEKGEEVTNPEIYQKAAPVRTPSNDTRFIAITGRPESSWTPEDREFVQGYKNMVNTKTTEPGVARMNALSQGRVVTPVDPNDPASEIYSTAGQAMRQGLHAPGSIDYRLQMPTGTERGRADLAMSAREQMTDMENILRTRSDLFGPVAGKITNVTQWIGSQDPDAQRFQAAARITADHLAGVFGGRSQTALNAIYELVGRNATNPKAAIAGLEQLDKAARKIQSRGIGPNAAGGSSGASGGGKIKIVRDAQGRITGIE